MPALEWSPDVTRRIANGRYNGLREERVGVMLHYDGSGSDAGSLAWFADPRCRVSYQWVVLDDGSAVRIAPDDRRAWHAGVCRPSGPRLDYRDANSAFYGIAAATNDVVDVTPLQLLTITLLVRLYFADHGWSLEETWRITTHRAEAWERGRKTDPEGKDSRNPIYSVADVAQLLPHVRP